MMPTPTYDLIYGTTLTSTTGSVTISGLDSTYHNWVLVIDAIFSGSDYPTMNFNSDTNQNYDLCWYYTTGTSNSSGNNDTSSTIFPANVAYGSQNVQTVVHLLNPTSGGYYKAGLSQHTNNGEITVNSFQWTSASAITSITLDTNSGFNYLSGSKINLYGLVNA